MPHENRFILTYPIISAPFFLLFLISMNLKTEIDETGISYQFFPYHISPVKISWDEVGRVYTREYTSAEFGGRGKRPSWTNSGFGINYNHSIGKACTLSGNTGLQIVFKNGEKLLLGTQKPDEIEETLRLLQSIGKIPKSVDPKNSASFI